MIFCVHCGANSISVKVGIHYCSKCDKGNKVEITKKNQIVISPFTNDNKGDHENAG